MKNILILFIMISMSFTYAQEKKEPKLEKEGDFTFVTYYHDNGKISQTGMFNAEGEVHGEWKSYDIDGEKIALGNYENNKKVGKWFFWTDNKLKEVDFVDSRIVGVKEWKDKKVVAIRNR